jgi:hypothetical protein
MVCDAGDSTQRIVGIGTGSVDLADDRMFRPCEARQRRHRRHDPVAAAMLQDRIEKSGWIR